MTLKLTTFSLSLLIALASCRNHTDTPEPPQTIDVSAQWQIDPAGGLIYSPGDKQWQKTVFTAKEQQLFTSLDTVNLTGTNTPDSVKTGPPIYNAVNPNPFNTAHDLGFVLKHDFAGEVVLKYVIVDSTMTALDKKAVRMHSPFYISVMPSIPSGKFRLYYSLSSEAKPDFFTTWGNIEKLQ